MDPDGNSISGLTKTIIGSAQVAIGTVGVLFCGAAATALVADDATFIGILDDPLALALAAGATASTLYAVSGVKLTFEGLNEASDAVSEAAHNLIQNAKTPAAAASPNPLPPDDENDPKQSAKDSKKLDNKGAEKFSQEKGYKDAHELKKDILRGQKDKTVGHYDIYKNAKTGESFLINKSGTVVIPIE